MATVYVMTAGGGNTYRGAGYLESEQAYGFAQDYNGIAPAEPVQGRNGRLEPRPTPRWCVAN